MNTIRLKDKEFKPFITSDKIQSAIGEMAKKMNQDMNEGEVPLFISILNGSFMFTADLIKHVSFDCEISFLKLASYQGDSSTGKVRQLVGINEKIEGRTVIVLEDIVDTGLTLVEIKKQLAALNPKQVKIASLLLKPEAYHNEIPIDYVGMEIPNDFIVGYGLDYDGLGRNYPDIYSVVK
ncbi:MAG: hypoxanthine phosphoribosyltransferase [Bacteroidales bacterium]|jgi:hypoxanthine phosphoribosyltransferase